MCDPSKGFGGNPEKRLADLILKETGVIFDQHTLRLFVKLHWTKIAALSHQIHDIGEAAR